jgi:hypothetical protein
MMRRIAGAVIPFLLLPGSASAGGHEHKLVARSRRFRFADKDVEATTTTKTIEFYPA